LDPSVFDLGAKDIAWCPGCGNYGILKVLKQALAELDIDPRRLVIVSGIGQAAKTPHYFRTNYFNGLHGRAIPVATAIKAVNPDLVVVAESGDGCMYGEGGNHLVHAIRRNPDITVLVHNNMVYALTKGQASPTSQLGFKTPTQMAGVFEEPFNPLALAVSMDASFVARTFIGDAGHTKETLKKAILHKGFSLVDIFQPCVTFNKVNTYEWFKDNTYYIGDGHDPRDRIQAFGKAIERHKLPLGTIYVNPKPTFEDNLGAYQDSKDPVYKRDVDLARLSGLIDSYRTM